jgi:ribosomal-protein-alanine N-acetyltransferase
MPMLFAPAVTAGRLSGRPQPRLTDDGLIVRPWESSDTPALVAAYCDPAIQQWHGRSMTLADAAGWIEERHQRWGEERGADWAVVSDDAVVGRVSLRTVDLEQGVGEVSYWVVPSQRGRGIAVRAVVTVTDWAFRDVGLHRIELVHAVANGASCRVADRAGYALEGTRRQHFLLADGRHDAHLHARLNPANR